MHLFSLLIGLIAAVLLTDLPRALAAEGQSRCSAPSELIEDEPLLPHVSEHLKKHLPITILVIGGASTAGAATDNAYPHFLEAALRQRHPESTINVINRGIAGQLTEQMAERFPKDVYPQQPTLVIWETGTVDAVRAEDINSFADALSTGITALQEHKYDVMLIDMQYNPSTVSVINFQPYLDALRHTAALQDVYMFQRYDVMKYWSEAGVFDFINVPKEKRSAMAREFYECLGERLADAVDFGAR